MKNIKDKPNKQRVNKTVLNYWCHGSWLCMIFATKEYSTKLSKFPTMPLLTSKTRYSFDSYRLIDHWKCKSLTITLVDNINAVWSSKPLLCSSMPCAFRAAQKTLQSTKHKNKKKLDHVYLSLFQRSDRKFNSLDLNKCSKTTGARNMRFAPAHSETYWQLVQCIIWSESWILCLTATDIILCPL
jgi:hypothetical protein